MKKQVQATLISRKDLALRWDLSRETLKRYEKAGILIPLKLVRGVRYRLTDIEQIEKESEVAR